MSGQDDTTRKKRFKKKGLFDPRFPELFASDVSIYPSYSNLKDPYYLAVRRLKARKIKEYREVFTRDLEELFMLGTSALSGVQVSRCFILGLDVPKKFPEVLTGKEKARLEDILKYNVF